MLAIAFLLKRIVAGVWQDNVAGRPSLRCVKATIDGGIGWGQAYFGTLPVGHAVQTAQ